jgi:hypothetical protein
MKHSDAASMTDPDRFQSRPPNRLRREDSASRTRPDPSGSLHDPNRHTSFKQPRKRYPLSRFFRRKTGQVSTKETAERRNQPTTPTLKRLIAPPVRENDSFHTKPKLDEEGAFDLRRRSRLAKGLKHRSDLSTRWFLAHSPLAAPEGTTAHGQVRNRESSCQRSWSHLTLLGFRPLQRFSQEKRPTPGLPHPAVLHSQVFTTSQCFIPLLAVPASFHAGSTPGVLDPAELSPTEDRVPFRLPIPS